MRSSAGCRYSAVFPIGTYRNHRGATPVTTFFKAFCRRLTCRARCQPFHFGSVPAPATDPGTTSGHRRLSCHASPFDKQAPRAAGVILASLFLHSLKKGGTNRNIHGHSPSDHRPSHPYNAGTEHVGFSPTKKALCARTHWSLSFREYRSYSRLRHLQHLGAHYVIATDRIKPFACLTPFLIPLQVYRCTTLGVLCRIPAVTLRRRFSLYTVVQFGINEASLLESFSNSGDTVLASPFFGSRVTPNTKSKLRKKNQKTVLRTPKGRAS